MNTEASEQLKTAIENSVTWYLSDKLQDATSSIATKKFLTPDNLLVTLTSVNVPEATIPRVKVSIFTRVAGGVEETGYQLFGDHRLLKYKNDMIFGSNPSDSGAVATEPVYQVEAEQLLALINSLQTARQTL